MCPASRGSLPRHPDGAPHSEARRARIPPPREAASFVLGLEGREDCLKPNACFSLEGAKGRQDGNGLGLGVVRAHLQQLYEKLAEC